ncbi:MAG: hydroxyacylglutathione hydrolase [Cellvibrionales bacterium TMED148]|nr:hydroxyacylglutathione hydrolase [Porticoccaceae bacterium]RPG94005.1 MAG: hydroxyacylglutathione hydrolase [Cellvibrionales bacterium TMED148]
MQILETDIKITALPALSDNYIWVLASNKMNSAYVVDPGDAKPVLNWLNTEQLPLKGILITHHHADHVGGVNKLLNHCNVPVFGPKDCPARCVTHPLEEGDIIECLGLQLSVLLVPGHTLDHIAYFSGPHNDQSPILFSGDTLFAGGCGRLFEGTAEQMYVSLEKLSSLPDQTRVFCGHEYTISNLLFAKAVEPDNQDIQSRIKTDKTRLGRGIPTLPSTIGIEKLTNPFLRVEEPVVASSILSMTDENCDEPIRIFGALRRWKDNF